MFRGCQADKCASQLGTGFFLRWQCTCRFPLHFGEHRSATARKRGPRVEPTAPFEMPWQNPPLFSANPAEAAKLETGTYQTHSARHSKTRGLHQLSHPWRTSHRKLWNVGRGRTARVETSLAVFLRHGRRDALSELLTRAPRRRRKTKRFCFLVLRQARHTCFRTRIHASYIRGNTPSLGRVLICK